MKILLDTCAFLWLTTDAPELRISPKITSRNGISRQTVRPEPFGFTQESLVEG